MKVSRRWTVTGFAALAFSSALAAGFPRAQNGLVAKLRQGYLRLCGPGDLAEHLQRACEVEADAGFRERRLVEIADSYADFESDADSFRTWFAIRTAQDFAEGRVVRVNGWVLSETECIFYAGTGAGKHV